MAPEGYFIHYGLDRTWDQRFGGRKFMWRYRYKLHTEEDPWRFEALAGPVTFEAISEFPWEKEGIGVGQSPWGTKEV